MSVKPDEIATLVELFAASDWDELHVEIDGLQLFLSTNPEARLANSAAAAPVAAAFSAPAAPAAAPAPRQEIAPPPAAAPVSAGSDAIQPHWVAVTAPNLGTFYRAPKPGAAPFVELGQAIEVDSDLCLLEVMKLFTAVKSKVKGTVRRICVQDADLVEFDQPLFYIEPA